MSLFRSDTKTEAFSRVYDEIYDLLYLGFLKMTRDEELTKDLLQEAFIKLWDQWEEIDNTVNLAPLVYTYAKHAFFDHLRKERLRKEKLHITSYKETSTHTAEDIMQAKQTQEKVNTIVSRMPEGMRRVYLLSRQARLNNREIAHQLSISPFTVKRHLQNAMALLKKSILQDT